MISPEERRRFEVLISTKTSDAAVEWPAGWIKEVCAGS